MRMQITQPARDMKYADRFFFRDEDGAVDLIRAVSRQLQKLSSSVQVFGSRDYRRGDSSSGADELDAAAQSFKELASDFDRQLLCWNAEARPQICLSAQNNQEHSEKTLFQQ